MSYEEEVMIDYLMNDATEEEIEDFLGYAPLDISREVFEEALAQMPDEEFEKFLYEFGLYERPI